MVPLDGRLFQQFICSFLTPNCIKFNSVLLLSTWAFLWQMQEKMIEIEELKKELVNAQMAASKARKLDDNFLQAPEVQRRVRSLDGCEADSSLKQLRAQVYYNM